MTKVLVIDDDSMVRETVVRLLILEGYQVIEAAYGQAGYASAISDSPNIILLDLNMPIMDGFEVLHKLKGNPETERIPVIVLTARIEAESNAGVWRREQRTTSRSPGARLSFRNG